MTRRDFFRRVAATAVASQLPVTLPAPVVCARPMSARVLVPLPIPGVPAPRAFLDAQAKALAEMSQMVGAVPPGTAVAPGEFLYFLSTQGLYRTESPAGCARLDGLG